MTILMKIVGIAGGLFFFSSFSCAAELSITVDRLRSDRGQVLLCVFSEQSLDREAFPDCTKGRPVRQGKGIIARGKAVVTYTGLKDGVYAVAVIHDENGNGALDTNFLGIPAEGVGISNNPRLLGKPQYAEARFEVKGKTEITVEAKYIL